MKAFANIPFEIPNELLTKVLDYYMDGNMIFLDLSFPIRHRAWAKENPQEAVALVESLFKRIARKQKVEFEVITTGSLGIDTQVHFHIVLLTRITDEKELVQLRDSIVRRWSFVGNRNAHPQVETLIQGYSVGRTGDDYAKSFSKDGISRHLDKILYRIGYCLDLSKNNRLFRECDSLKLNRVFTNRRAGRDYKKPQTEFKPERP